MIAVAVAAMLGIGVMVANMPVSDEKKLIDDNRTSISVSYEKMAGATKITRVVIMPDATIPMDCNQSENSKSCKYTWGSENMILKDSVLIVTTELNVKKLDCDGETNKHFQCIERQTPLTDEEWIIKQIAWGLK